MLLWFAGGSFLAVWLVFRDPAIDHRLVMAAAVVGMVKLTLGLTSDAVPVTVNVLWALYDVAVLAVLLDALTYRPARAARKAAARERATAGLAVAERVAPAAGYDGYGAASEA